MHVAMSCLTANLQNKNKYSQFTSKKKSTSKSSKKFFEKGYKEPSIQYQIQQVESMGKKYSF